MTPRCGDDVVVRSTTELEDRTQGRSRRPLVILAVLAVVAVGAIAVVYMAFFNEDAPAPFTLSDQPATSAPAVTSAAGGTATGGSGLAGTWRVASGSEAGYRVLEKLVRLPAQSDAVGRTPAVTGTVRVEGSGGSLVATDARFEADLTKLTSDEANRDRRIRTQGLQTDTFPKATFVSTQPIPLPAETATGRGVQVQAEGDLTLHGVTKRVTIPLDVRVTGDKGELTGSLTFPMSDFAIDPPNVAGVVTVDSDATLEFKLVLERA